MLLLFILLILFFYRISKQFLFCFCFIIVINKILIYTYVTLTHFFCLFRSVSFLLLEHVCMFMTLTLQHRRQMVWSKGVFSLPHSLNFEASHFTPLKILKIHQINPIKPYISRFYHTENKNLDVPALLFPTSTRNIPPYLATN